MILTEIYYTVHFEIVGFEYTSKTMYYVLKKNPKFQISQYLLKNVFHFRKFHVGNILFKLMTLILR